MNKRDIINSLEILNRTSQETKEVFFQAGKVLNATKGTILIQKREETKAVYFQLTGKSIVYNLSREGRRKILFVFGPGALLNGGVFKNHESSIYCETIEKSKIFKIPSTEFVKLMENDFEFTKNVMYEEEKKICRLSHQLKNTMSNIYLEKKLASKLWKLAKDFGIQKEDGVEIDINLTVTFLADMIGIPRETASRICGMLIDKNLILMEKKRITIIDPNKLLQFYKNGTIE